MKRIRVSIGSDVQHEVALDRELIVGRSEAADLRIQDGEVSSRHLQVRPDGERVFVTDLGSTNGSVLDGGEALREGEEVPFGRGQKLMIGPAILEIVELAQDDQPQSGAAGMEQNTMVVDGAALQKQLVAVARFKAAGPRLVIAAEHDRRTIPVVDMETVIGRDAGACQVEIAHASISGKHATLSFAGGRFAVKDLGSSNGTFVEDQQISEPTKLGIETAVRFGTVDCLFVQDPPESSDEARLSDALVNHVVGIGKATSTQGRQVTQEHREKGRSVGELFVEQGILTPMEWSEIYGRRQSIASQPPVRSGKSRGLAWLLVALLVIAVAIVAYIATQ